MSSIDEIVPTSGVFPRVPKQTIDLRNTSVQFQSFGNQEVTNVNVKPTVEQAVDASARPFNRAKVLQPSGIVFRVIAKATPFAGNEPGQKILIKVVDRQTGSQRSGVGQSSTIAYSRKILFE